MPRLISYRGVLKDPTGKPVGAVTGVTFLIYKNEESGAPLWMETQSVTPGRNGQYSVTLGATTLEGLPADLFANGDARWLAVQVAGQPEAARVLLVAVQVAGQPEAARVLLVAVPYAMKAGDAETLGGLPPSAFVLATPSVGARAAAGASAATSGEDADALPPTLPPASPVTTNGGTVNAIPLFSSATNIQNSILTQTGTSAINVQGKMMFPATGTANASKGFVSQAQIFVASAFNSGTSTPVNQKFQWQAEPANNNSSTAFGTLNLLYGSGAANPAETGLKINNKGVMTFAAGQKFPGTGSVTSVASGMGLKGGPITGSGTLRIDTAVVPQLNAANTFVGNQTVTGSLTASGQISGANAVLDGANIGVSASGSQYGGIFATSGGTGLYAYNSNDCNFCTGLDGYAFGGTKGSNINVGVLGSVAGGYGAGVFGQTGTLSATGSLYARGAGVVGDGGPDSAAVGATSDNAPAISAFNNSSSPTIEGLNFAGSSGTLLDLQAFQEVLTGECSIDGTANLSCTGSVSSSVATDNVAHRVSVYGVAAAENWFEDAGSGRLSGGRAVVNLEPVFGKIVNSQIEYHVFLTPKGDCEGLYVSGETPQGFEVHELRGGHSSIAFDYRIMAKRKGYESVRLAAARQPAKLPTRRSVPLKAPVHRLEGASLEAATGAAKP